MPRIVVKKYFLHFLLLLGDFILANLAYLLMAQNQSFYEMVRSINEYFWPSFAIRLPTLGLVFGKLLMIIFFVLFMRAIFPLLLGRTPWMFLLRLNFRERGLIGRLTGSFFLVSSIMFFPVNLLLSLLGQRNFSEIFSQNQIDDEHNNSFSTLISITVMTCLLGFSIYLPFKFDKLKNSVEFSRKEINPLVTTKPESLGIWPGSNRFSFKIKSLNSDGVIYLPKFEVKKVGKSKRISPIIQIIDRRYQSIGEIKVLGSIDQKALMKNSIWEDVFYSSRYPRLYSLQTGEILEKTNWSEQSEIFGKWHPLLKDEFLNYLNLTFQFSHQGLREQVLSSFNSNISALIRFKSNFVKKVMKIHSHTKMRFQENGNFLFLSASMNEGDHYSEIWYPIGTHFPKLIKFDWKLGSKIESFQSFKNNNFKAPIWFFDYKKFIKEPELEAEMSVLHIIDLLVKNNLKNIEIELIEEFTYRYYFNLFRKIIRDEDQFVLTHLKENYLNLHQIITLRQRQKVSFTNVFIEQLKSLKKAVEINDKAYFNL